MNTGRVLTGLGLGAFGIAFYAIARWYALDEARSHRMARSRWGWDKLTQRRLRTGEMSQEAWFDEFASGQRLIVKWAFTPFMALWLGGCIFMVVRGLLDK